MSIFDTFLNVRVFVETLPLILSGLSTTLLLGFVCIALGSVTGLALALARLYAPGPLRALTIAYIDVFRAIPILVLLLYVAFVLAPALGWAWGGRAMAPYMDGLADNVKRCAGCFGLHDPPIHVRWRGANGRLRHAVPRDTGRRI